MSSVEETRNLLSMAGEQAGNLMYELLETKRGVEELQGVVARIVEGSNDETIQQSLATYALAGSHVQEALQIIEAAIQAMNAYANRL